MIKSTAPFLTFAGNCNKALDFYEKYFGAKIIEKWHFSEWGITDQRADQISSATFSIGESDFFASDFFSDMDGMNYQQGNNVSIWFEYSDLEEFLEAYELLKSADVEIMSDKQDSFWNSKYAKIKDPFGICWELNVQFEDEG